MSRRADLRLFVLRVVVLAILATLFGRLWFLQVYAGEDYTAAASENRIREVVEPAPRGEVYDALLPHATHQVLTEVDLEPEGDVHYPQFPAGEWVETRREAFDGYERVWLERMDPAA